MTWDGVRRRSEDNGRESPEAILARIEERVNNISDKMTLHMVSFEEHRKEDDKNFAGIYKWVFIGVGIIGTLQFILSFKH